MRRMATLLPSPMLKKKPSGLLKGKKTHTEATKDDGGGKATKLRNRPFARRRGVFQKEGGLGSKEMKMRLLQKRDNLLILQK